MNPIVESGLRVGPYHVVGQGFAVYHTAHKMVAVAATKQKIWKIEHEIGRFNNSNTYKFVLNPISSLATLSVDGVIVGSSSSVNRTNTDLMRGLLNPISNNQYISVVDGRYSPVEVSHLKIWKHTKEYSTQGN